MRRAAKPAAVAFDDWWRKHCLKTREQLSAEFLPTPSPSPVSASRNLRNLPRRLRKGGRGHRSRVRDFQRRLRLYLRVFKDDLSPLAIGESSALLPFNNDDCRRPLGVFARWALSEGTRIPLLGTVTKEVSKSRYLQHNECDSVSWMDVRSHGGVASTRALVAGPVRYFNHCHIPNASVDDRWIELLIEHRVKAGSEIFINYGDGYFVDGLACTNRKCCASFVIVGESGRRERARGSKESLRR